MIACLVFLHTARLAPGDMRRALVHMGVTLVACQLFAPAASA
jgi:hypothetical protein